MLYTNLNKMFELRGIKNPNKFLVQNGFSRDLAYRLTSHRFNTLRFDKVEKLCIALSCTPNDLLEFQPSKNSQIPESHPLNNLKPTPKFNFEEITKDVPVSQIPELLKAIETAKQNLPK